MTIKCPACGIPNHPQDCLQGYLREVAQLHCRYCGSWWTAPTESLVEDLSDCTEEQEELK